MGFRGLKLIKELPRFHFSCLPAIYMLIGPATESEQVSAPGRHHAEAGGERRVMCLHCVPWTAEAGARHFPKSGLGLFKNTF